MWISRNNTKYTQTNKLNQTYTVTQRARERERERDERKV